MLLISNTMAANNNNKAKASEKEASNVTTKKDNLEGLEEDDEFEEFEHGKNLHYYPIRLSEELRLERR